MNLENTVKYHFAKSTLISDSPRATGSDSLTGTDVIAAMGMTQERAAMDTVPSSARWASVTTIGRGRLSCCLSTR